MEISLNKQENTNASDQFVSFSIREYVAEIRKKDPKKCWPFGSLGNPDMYNVFASIQLAESSILCSQNCPKDHIDGSDDKPEHKEASNSINSKETFNGKEDQSQTTDMIESPGINDNTCKRDNHGYPKFCKVIYKAPNQPENSANGSSDNDIDEPGRNGPRRKHQRFRLLSDILKNLDNVNTRFATETEDEADDVTLDALIRKEKGVEVITPMSKNKMMTNHVKEPRFEKEENSDVIGPIIGSRKTRLDHMDSQITAKRKKVRLQDENGAQARLRNKEKPNGMQKDGNQYKEVSSTEYTETCNEDSEMEAVMLLASRFNEEGPSSPADGAKKTQLNMEVELLEVEENQLSESGQDQGFAVGTSCACVQKKMRASLNLAGNKSKDTRMNIAKVAKHRSSTPLVCSINRNPADFSIPNAENVFMR